MAVCNYNCDELSEFELAICGVYLKGGIDIVGILDCDHAITDFSDETDVANDITSNKLTLMKNVKATYAAEAVEGENPIGCGAENILDGLNHTLTIKNFNVNSTNDGILEILNGYSSFLLWRECQNGKIRVVQKRVTWTALPAGVPESSREKQMYTITAKWSSDANEFPELFDEPGTALTA